MSRHPTAIPEGMGGAVESPLRTYKGESQNFFGVFF